MCKNNFCVNRNKMYIYSHFMCMRVYLSMRVYLAFPEGYKTQTLGKGTRRGTREVGKERN